MALAESPSDQRRRAARAALPKKSRPAKPYRAIRWNRAHKLAAALPDRAHRAFFALLVRAREVQSGIVFIGNDGLGARVERCGKTIQRAKPQLRSSGLVIVHLYGSKNGGGKMIDQHGRCVEAATGYELADVIFEPKSPAPEAVKPVTEPSQGRVHDQSQRFRALAAGLSPPGPSG